MTKKKTKKKVTKKKVAKKKATKKKVAKKMAPVASLPETWIYCDRCEEPTGFKYAARGLETHNVATCADCLTVLDKVKAKRKEEQEAYMLNRSRERRARIMSSARSSLNTYRGI